MRGRGEMGKGAGVCVCAFASECRKLCGPMRECVFGKERVRFLTQKGRQRGSLLCQRGVDTKRHSRAGAHMSMVTALPLSPLHSFVMPLVV